MASEKRDMFLRCQNGPFYYHSDGVQRGEETKARCSLSDRYEPQPLPYKVRVHQFPEDKDPTELKIWYQRQITCSNYSNAFLKMHYLHLSKRRVVHEDYEWNIAYWMEQKKLKSSYADMDTWWREIREDFILIFQPVFEGLKILHLKKEYHGNLALEDSIKIEVRDKEGDQEGDKEVVRGILTNCVAFGYDVDHGDDFNQLLDLINKIIRYPFLNSGRTLVVNNEVKNLCLEQLKRYSSDDDLRLKWSLDPILFWDVTRRISFLQAINWLYDRNAPLPPFVRSTRQHWNWRFLRGDLEMLNVYYHKQQNRNQVPAKYARGHNLIRFYRNCIHHLIDQNGKVNCPIEVHKKFFIHYDVLEPSIATATSVFQHYQGATRYDKDIIESFARQFNL